MKIIETTWNGFRFRSRTEARWAVFFTRAGIRFDYEKEGVVLRSGPYLPDFWLRDLSAWLEVKGAEPTPRERALCAELSIASGQRVLLAIGAPEPEEQILVWRSGEVSDTRYSFVADRRNEGQFWLWGDGHGFALNAGREDHERAPGYYSPINEAYAAAKAERFDGKPPPPSSPVQPKRWR